MSVAKKTSIYIISTREFYRVENKYDPYIMKDAIQ